MLLGTEQGKWLVGMGTTSYDTLDRICDKLKPTNSVEVDKDKTTIVHLNCKNKEEQKMKNKK